MENQEIKEKKMKESDFKKDFMEIRRILNEIDPEGLEPGQSDGAPIDEYEMEVVRILSFVNNLNLTEIELRNQINNLWKENFGHNFPKLEELISRLKEFKKAIKLR